MVDEYNGQIMTLGSYLNNCKKYKKHIEKHKKVDKNN